MKIQYCSDLHLEFIDNRIFLGRNPLNVAGDVLILAGDIVPMHKKYTKYAFFDFVSEHYNKVYWLAGNHEYYHRDIADFHDSFDIPIRKNVSLINNLTFINNNIRFIFTTLWSDIRSDNAKLIEKSVSDFVCIHDDGKKFTPVAFNRMHKNCLEFLKTSLEQKFDNTVVVTHHLPARACNSKEFLFSKINDAFCVDLTDFVAQSNAKYWIYGHSHFNQKPLEIGSTMLLTNQLGYVQSGEHLGFKPDAFIELN